MDIPSEKPAFCLNCGYDLRSATSDRCSECGWEFEQSLIPWERDVESVWRFPATCFALLFWNRKMRSDLLRRHDPALARKFHNRCAILAYLFSVLFFAYWHFASNGAGKDYLYYNKNIGSALGMAVIQDIGNVPALAFTHDVSLLLGMALSGWPGLLLGIAVFTLAIRDCMSWAQEVLESGLDIDRKATLAPLISAMGCYLSGLVAITMTLMLMSRGVFIATSRNGNQELKLPLFILGFVGMCWPFALGLTFGQIGRIRKSFLAERHFFLKCLRWVVTLFWRLLFWLLLIPCFIGFIRLVVESLGWTR